MITLFLIQFAEQVAEGVGLAASPKCCVVGVTNLEIKSSEKSLESDGEVRIADSSNLNLAVVPDEFLGPIRTLRGDLLILARLRELGFITGEMVAVVGRAPFGEPILVEIRGATVALRKSEAECILV